MGPELEMAMRLAVAKREQLEAEKAAAQATPVEPESDPEP